jgi:hypothetical protein
MNRLSVLRWGALIGIALLANGFFGLINQVSSQSSDSRSLRWDRFDVTIDNINTSANEFRVTEAYELYIERGPYSYGFAQIPLGRVESIDNVTVSQDGTPLSATCSSSAGTYCVTQDSKNLSINYYFLRSVQSGQQPHIQIQYTVHGGLRSYAAGDELYWVALPSDTSGFDVVASRVVVNLPPNTPILAETGYPNTWAYSAEGDTLTWTSPTLPSNHGSFEVRVKYPHDPAMKKPAWQAGYDREQYYIDHIQPIASLLLGVITVLLTLVGVLFVVVRYLRHGRDPVTVTAPEYLTEPPSDELPGIIGLLLDEKADMQDIMATLVDLARRGYFVIEQKEEKTLGLFKNTEFEFHRTDKSWDDLRDYEEALMRGLFPEHRKDTDLDQLKQKFYAVIPGIKQQMYNNLITAGYFTRSPETTRRLWLWGGIAAIVAASGLFWLSRSVTIVSPLISLPPIGLGIVGAVGLLFADVMPAKTEKGAQQAALWRAFRHYLKNINRYHQGDAPADEQFQRYLPFATAFGIEKEFMHDLTPVLTSMPGWYFPTYMGGPWGGGYRGRTVTGSGQPMSMGGGSLGTPSLSGLDRSLSEGLNSMSRGMTQMLNEASHAMTSRPQSSGRGGGGFSGGGGGGGGGGGSRGFG